MCLPLFAVALTIFATNAYADDVTRNITDLEPITTTAKRIRPEFESGVVRLDMSVADVRARLSADGYVIDKPSIESLEVTVGDRKLVSAPYIRRINAAKMFDGGAREEKVSFAFLPGGSAAYRLERLVLFHYRAGQATLKRADVEKSVLQKFGAPLRTTEEKSKTGNVHIAGLYCYEANAEPMLDPQKCDVVQARANGYDFVIVVNPAGDVHAFAISYANEHYREAYQHEVKDRLKRLIDTDQIWEFRAPKFEP